MLISLFFFLDFFIKKESFFGDIVFLSEEAPKDISKYVKVVLFDSKTAIQLGKG